LYCRSQPQTGGHRNSFGPIHLKINSLETFAEAFSQFLHWPVARWAIVAAGSGRWVKWQANSPLLCEEPFQDMPTNRLVWGNRREDPMAGQSVIHFLVHDAPPVRKKNKPVFEKADQVI
jgi:hypothetical protein